MRDRDFDDIDFDWPCLNEEDGLDCEYPFCQCEAMKYSEYLKELPDIFDDEEIFDEEWNDGLDFEPGEGWEDRGF